MIENRYYGTAAEELARQEIDKDMFARAYAAAMGDPERTKAIYIGMRAEVLKEIERRATIADEQRERESRKSGRRWPFRS